MTRIVVILWALALLFGPGCTRIKYKEVKVPVPVRCFEALPKLHPVPLATAKATTATAAGADFLDVVMESLLIYRANQRALINEMKPCLALPTAAEVLKSFDNQ